MLVVCKSGSCEGMNGCVVTYWWVVGWVGPTVVKTEAPWGDWMAVIG